MWDYGADAILDQRLTVLVCERGSQSTSSGAHGPSPLSQGSCPCRPCGKSASPSGGGRQGQTCPHSWHSGFPAWSRGSPSDWGSVAPRASGAFDRDGDEFAIRARPHPGASACQAIWHRVQAGR